MRNSQMLMAGLLIAVTCAAAGCDEREALHRVQYVSIDQTGAYVQFYPAPAPHPEPVKASHSDSGYDDVSSMVGVLSSVVSLASFF